MFQVSVVWKRFPAFCLTACLRRLWINSRNAHHWILRKKGSEWIPSTRERLRRPSFERSAWVMKWLPIKIRRIKIRKLQNPDEKSGGTKIRTLQNSDEAKSGRFKIRTIQNTDASKSSHIIIMNLSGFWGVRILSRPKFCRLKEDFKPFTILLFIY